MPQRVFATYTDEGPITVDVDGKRFRVHSIEVKKVQRDDEGFNHLPPRLIPYTEQYELVLKIRPEQDRTAFRVMVNDKEISLDTIKINGGLGNAYSW